MSLHPNFSVAHEVFADLMLVEGQFEMAVKSYQQSLKLEPSRSSLNAKISRAKDLIKASAATAGSSSNTMAFADEIAQAKKFKLEGEPAEAENIYRNILRRDPNHAEAMRLLAAIASVHHNYGDAELLLKRAVSKAPKHARAWSDLSKAQMELGQYQAAIESAEQIVNIAPDIGESHVALGNAQAQASLTEQAIDSYSNALKVAPKHKGAFAGLAHQLKTVGRQQESIAAHRQNISHNPGNAEPYWNLANMKTFRFEDSEVQAMEALLEQGGLDELSIAQLCNSLGLEYEGRKDYERAFSFFQRCNASKRGMENYDPVGHELLIDQLSAVFNQQFLQQQQGQGTCDKSPILIVGLPRSGSTLIEQIVASHSQVEGTHELHDLPQLVDALNKKNANGLHFPDNIPDFNPQAWSRLGDQYLERTLKYRSGAPRFIDKNPNNFIYIGLLHLMLPNAKIINARRHPLDSCFGSYKQLFASGQPFSYDLTELGEYYLQYQTLMDHWHQVLPGKVLDVHYDEVVTDLDTQVRRILDFCDLPFEESCLKFHETDRAVKTASSEQVRQPIYSSSVNLWKHYESNLDELIEILEPLLLELPAVDQPNFHAR